MKKQQYIDEDRSKPKCEGKRRQRRIRDSGNKLRQGSKKLKQELSRKQKRGKKIKLTKQ
jgi:hypothetical protein